MLHNYTLPNRPAYAASTVPSMSVQMHKGSITLAFWIYSLNVRFTVKCVFNVIFEFSTLKMTSKTHATVKRTSKLHIKNASVINP
jgi:hypothetical protein